MRSGLIMSWKAFLLLCSEQTALARQDLSCTYLAHHELESVFIIITIMCNSKKNNKKNLQPLPSQQD